MATKTHTVDRDARVTATLGSGACDHLDVGVYGGYTYETWLAFIGESWSGIPSAASITSAVLYVYASGQYHIARTAGTMRVRRTSSLGTTFTEGTASHPLTSSNAVRGDNAPATTATNEATGSISDSNGWKTVTITDIIKDYYGQANYALQLHANSGVYEFAAREAGSNDAYVLITYNPNSAPTAATIVSPTGGTLVSSQTPSLTFTHHDPDGDTATAYQVQVDNNSDFSSVTWDSGELTASPPADGANKSVTVGTSLTRGTTYYWRARTKDANGFGPWSATTAQFKIMSAPTATVLMPSADGEVAPLYYSAGSNTTPKFRITWSYSCPDGHAQSSVVIRIYADPVGAALHTHNHSGTATTADISGYSPVNGTAYNVTVQPQCTGTIFGNETNQTDRTCRARWSRASYFYNMGSTPTSWGNPTVNGVTGPTNANVVEYSASTTTAEPGTWYSSLSSVPLGTNTYVWHRVTQYAWGSSAPTKPTVTDVKLRWNTAVLSPDNWSLGTNTSIDLGQFVFGTQCLKIETTAGTNRNAFQDVDGLLPNTTYTLSGYILSSGNSRAALRFYPFGEGTTQLATSDTAFPITATPADGAWQRVYVSYTTGASETGVRIYASTLSTGSNGAWAWFDALKLEASAIVSPWTPGFVGGGVAVDAGGLQVDGSSGGVFRLRAANGMKVELGANMLEGSIRTFGKIGPYERVDVPASLAVNLMALLGGPLSSYSARPIAGRSGRIRGIAWRISAAPSAGTITLRPTVGGTSQTQGVVTLNSGSATTGFSNVTSSWDTFTAGSGLGINIESDSSLSPTTLDVGAWLMVEYDGEEP